MAHRNAERVQQVSTSTGTGALTFSGTVAKMRSFAAAGFVNGDTFWGLIEHETAAEWEVALCTYSSAGAGSITRAAPSASSTGSAVNFSAGNKYISVVLSASGGLFLPNAGTSTAPILAIGAATSGFYQPAAHSIAVRNAYQGIDAEENHQEIKFTHRGSIVIGPSTGTNDNRQPNQSAIEISYINGASAPVPMTICEYGNAGAAVEPVVFLRNYAASIGGAEVAVPAGSAVMTLQGQVTDGLGTANVAIGNLIWRVPSGAAITPSAGNTKTYPGELVIATSPGDGSTSITSRAVFGKAGEFNLVTGPFVMGTVNTVISKEMRGRFTSMQPPVRAAVADDAIYQLPIPAETGTAIVQMIGTALGSTNPWLMACVRVDGSPACEKAWVSSAADAASNVLFATAAVAPTDYTLYTDGKLTIVACADHSVYVVNRLGASRTFAYFLYLNAQTNP